MFAQKFMYTLFNAEWRNKGSEILFIVDKFPAQTWRNGDFV
jgi:hypothetical protein